MLYQIDSDPTHVLSRPAVVTRIAQSLARATKYLQSDSSAWPAAFRKDGGSTWTELSAVMALCSLMVLEVYCKGDSSRMSGVRERVLNCLTFVKPHSNTQTETQWLFLGRNIVEAVTSGSQGDLEGAFSAWTSSLGLKDNPVNWLRYFSEASKKYGVPEENPFRLASAEGQLT
jgi:hypothetical protein